MADIDNEQFRLSFWVVFKEDAYILFESTPLFFSTICRLFFLLYDRPVRVSVLMFIFLAWAVHPS